MAAKTERSGWRQPRLRRDALLVVAATLLVGSASIWLELGDRIQAVLLDSEHWELDELILAGLVLVIGVAWIAARQWQEARRVAQDLAESEARFRLLSEHAPDAIYVHDAEGRFLDANPAAVALCGYPSAQLIGHSFADHPMIPESQREAAAALLAQSASGRPTGPVPLRLSRRDGSAVYVEIQTRPFRLAGTELVLGMVRDVTERQHLMADLESSRESLEALVERSDAGLMVLDAHHRVVFANPVATYLLGRPHEELLGSVFDRLPVNSDPLDTRIVPAGGGERTVEVRATPTVWSDHEAFLVNLRDVSEERASERRAFRAEVMEGFRGLVGRLAHELNNALQGLTSGLDLLMLEGATPREAELIDTLNSSVGRVARLIRQLLLVTHHQEPGDLSVDLEALLLEAAPRWTADLAPNVAIVVDPRSAPALVRGSSQQIELVLGHLVENATESMPSGGQVTILCGSEAATGRAFVDVSDQGAGVPEKIRGRIFEPFVSGKDPLQHLGLGLTVASTIAESHGGAIELSPGPEGGTLVRLSLPAAPAVAQPIDGTARLPRTR
jgi:PAS domain S-box-containing protein